MLFAGIIGLIVAVIMGGLSLKAALLAALTFVGVSLLVLVALVVLMSLFVLIFGSALNGR